MKLSAIPDLASRRQLALAALAVWAVACAVSIPMRLASVVRNLGDTDDAMRLVMVRGLASGRGWFDQKLDRLQPPVGVYMHWSRLIDGGEALVLKLFGLVLAPDRAELAMRIAWPLLWVLPAVTAVLLVARRLGGGQAVFLGAICAAISLAASDEFQPGRVDHHGAQITLCMLAFAAAVQRPKARWAAASALATALGAAVGLEALAYHAEIGVFVGLTWALGRTPGRTAAAYGLTLALGVGAVHLLQTPPARWALGGCDALAANLVVAMAVAGLGLAAAALLARTVSPAVRLAGLAPVAGLAAAAYIGLHPACIHGPMAEIDPQLLHDWMSHIRELSPWPALMAQDPATALRLAAPVAVGALAWAWLGRRLWRDPAWMLSGALLACSAAIGYGAVRAGAYSAWFFAPLAAAAVADFTAFALGGAMVPAAALIAALVMGPAVVAQQAARPMAAAKGRPAVGLAPVRDFCTDNGAFAGLARLPPGLVLSEIDEGPFVLALTPHSVLSAPYHRMTWGIKQAMAALRAPEADARARIAALHVDYVVECPAHAIRADRLGLTGDSLQRRLDAGRPPPWLIARTQPGQALQVYAVAAPEAR